MSPLGSTRHDEVDADGERAVAALRQHFTTPGTASRLAALVAQQEAAANAARPQRKDPDPQLRAAFEQDGLVLADRIAAERADRYDILENKRTFNHVLPTSRELLHVYGADRDGTGLPQFYQLEWALVEPPGGTGTGARGDHRSGGISAEHYTTSGQLSSYAGVGMWLTPRIQLGSLSVRPYVPWSGYDILQHRVFDPSLHEQRWATGLAQMGIIVQSWDLAGRDPRLELSHWIQLWNRTELNPVGMRSYEGTENPSSGLTASVPAVSSRQYAIWVVCRALVAADPGFAVATRASASVTADVRFVVVEEMPF